MHSFDQIVDRLPEIVAAVLAILLLVEGIVRGLEGIAKTLLFFAGWTKTTKDDEALTGAAKWLHGAADWLAAGTAWLRPFSLRGTPRAPRIDAILMPLQPGVEMPPRPRDDEPTNPGGIKSKSREGFVNWQVLVEVCGWAAVIVVGALLGALLTGCGGGLADLDPEEAHQLGCQLTEESCDVCERAQALYCAEDSAARNEVRCTATAVLCAACSWSERMFCGPGMPPAPPPPAAPPRPTLDVVILELPAGVGET